MGQQLPVCPNCARRARQASPPSASKVTPLGATTSTTTPHCRVRVPRVALGGMCFSVASVGVTACDRLAPSISPFVEWVPGNPQEFAYLQTCCQGSPFREMAQPQWPTPGSFLAMAGAAHLHAAKWPSGQHLLKCLQRGRYKTETAVRMGVATCLIWATRHQNWQQRPLHVVIWALRFFLATRML